jgi:hypothetical protein
MTNVLHEWRRIPARVEAALAQGPLDEVVADGMTRREIVHHVVEANVVAASIVIAALGSPGATYDWSWMQPFGVWMDRMDYRRKPLEPSLRMLRAVNDWVAAQIEPLADGLDREVLLRDAPDAEPRRATVADVLRQEIEHADEHLG